MVPTDKNPVQLWYVPSLDQVWILNWRNEKDIDVKTVQVIEDAAQKKKHRAIRPEPIDAQFDIIQNIYIPEPQASLLTVKNVYSRAVLTVSQATNTYTFLSFRILKTCSNTVT